MSLLAWLLFGSKSKTCWKSSRAISYFFKFFPSGSTSLICFDIFLIQTQCQRAIGLG